MSEEREQRQQREAVIPVDLVNEQVIIAAAMHSEEYLRKLVGVFPSADVFTDANHRAIWSAFLELTRKNLAMDLAVVKQLAAGVDVSYLALLADTRPDAPDNLDWHVARMRWDRQRVAVVQGPLSAFLVALKDPRSEPERVRALARHVGESFEGSSAFVQNPLEVLREQMVDIDARVAGRAHYPYGIEHLDYFEPDASGVRRRRMVLGAAPGKTTVITGVSGGGKSTATGHLALGSGRLGRKVLYGAWEMGGGMTLEMLACISLGWSRSELLEGLTFRRDPRARDVIEARMSLIGKDVVFFKNPFRYNPSNIRRKITNDHNLDIIQEAIVSSGADVAIFDLWERCLKEREPSDVTNALERQQLMAEETRCHCFILQQQRLKDVEQRPDKRPTREGVKGTSAFVDIADAMIGVNLPHLWRRVPENVFEWIVLKQRYGKWPLAIECDWDGDKGSITNGRSIPYDPPGEEREEGMVGEFKAPDGFAQPKGRKSRAF